MLVACWSTKGGAGVTVVAAGVALGAARLGGGPPGRWASRRLGGDGEPGGSRVLLVDLTGDQPASLGLAEPTGPGVAEWLAADTEVPTDALARMEVPVDARLDLIPRGEGPLSPRRASLLLQVLAASGRTVVVDCGRPDQDEVARRFAAEADRSIAVTRLCILGLRALNRAPASPTGVVVVREVGRSIGVGDVASVAGAPVVADVAVDPGIARAVDAGLLAARLPRSFSAALASVAAPAAVASVG